MILMDMCINGVRKILRDASTLPGNPIKLDKYLTLLYNYVIVLYIRQ
jgi:hypothetical protein